MQYISSIDPNKFLFPRKLSILGSTGSIGRSALAVIEQHREQFQIIGLAGATNIELLAIQANKFRPEILAILHETDIKLLKSKLDSGYKPEILFGLNGYISMAKESRTDMILAAQVGAAGLAPVLSAAETGKIIALANKESLVLAGSLVRAICAKTGAVILPVDSEHNALFQVLQPENMDKIERLILTASGGPFYGKTKLFLSTVTPEQALLHPNWDMGAKVTIDSASLMNKGLEFIEAYHLFGAKVDEIDVLIHQQSIVHSLVAYKEGSQLAQLGFPNMKIPISICLLYPKRLPIGLNRFSLNEIAALTFDLPNDDFFPCLSLAKKSLVAGLTYPIVLNAANEIAVQAFLQKEISFLQIPEIIEFCLDNHKPETKLSLEIIEHIDEAARVRAKCYIRR